jgi:predicted small integral membrane protein
MSQNSNNSAKVLQTKCILVGASLTLAKVPWGVAFVCISCDWKKKAFNHATNGE